MVKGNGPITKLPGTKLALVSQLPTQNLSHPNEHGAAWLWSQKTTNLKRKRKKAQRTGVRKACCDFGPSG